MPRMKYALINMHITKTMSATPVSPIKECRGRQYHLETRSQNLS